MKKRMDALARLVEDSNRRAEKMDPGCDRVSFRIETDNEGRTILIAHIEPFGPSQSVDEHELNLGGELTAEGLDEARRFCEKNLLPDD